MPNLKYWTDCEDGYNGIDFKKLKEMEKPIIEYLNEHNLGCAIKIVFWDIEDNKKMRN